MRRHHNRNHPGGSDQSETRCRLQDPDDGVLLRLAKEIGLRLLLLVEQEVEMIVESGGPPLRTAGQLLLPLLSVTDPVDVLAGNQHATGAIQALDPSLPAHDVPDQREVDPSELAQGT